MKWQQLFEDRYEGHTRGKWYRMSCPYHSEKDASLDVDLEKSGFHCWGCGMTGNHVDLIMKLELVSESTSRNIISQYGFGGNTIYKHRGTLGEEASVVKETHYLNEKESLEKFMPVGVGKYGQYLKSRKIPLALALEYEFREGSAIIPGWDNRLIFPIKNIHGDLCSLEGRAVIQNITRYKKWTGSISGNGIFGIDKILPIGYKCPILFVVEGVIDCMSILSSGYPAVALSCSEISDTQIQQLKRVTTYPFVIYDGIKPGTSVDREKVVDRAKTILSKHFIKFNITTIPFEDTDSNDLLRLGKLKAYLKKLVKGI